MLRPHGTIIVYDPAYAHEIHIDVMTCCHCSKGWTVQPGSGKRRGFCTRCGRVTCGRPGCDECLPMEKRIDLYEAGKLAAL